jgi:hypothetical protein
VLRGGRGIERLEDLRLHARLLVEADLQVREQGELGASLGIAFEPRALVTRECLAQQPLTFRRVAVPQAGQEAFDLGASGGASGGQSWR